ncbi:hypothetical protein BDZ89DRAFT_577205 [Hymenopellis radicata]|nr:hypothetical protein BDZ89DRAFT_577205 [Hymenopellis radicata]
MNTERRETAVIIVPDSVTEDDPDTFEGYIGEDAGGHRVTFGRHNGCMLNDIPEDYMVYVKREFARTARSRRMPVFTAVERYTAWLMQYAQKNYKEFIVPFGKKHFGQKIAQCRDKNWFRWILKQPILRRKFPIFCAAVMEHLRNPIHQEVHRDIGELLSATQYADDIELMVYNRKERKELARNVWIAVSDDSDSDDVDSGSGSDDSTVSRVSGEEGEEEDSEDSKASASDFDAYDSDFIDDADADLDDDHPDMDDKTYFNWLQTHITQSDLLANLGSTYRVGRTGTFPNWQPKSSPAGDTTSDTDLTESDTRSDTTISDPEVAEDATETSSVTETTSVQDSTPPPTTRRKTLSKRKHLISEEDNNGIENDGSSQFDERSYEPSQEPSGRFAAKFSRKDHRHC